MLGEGRGGGKLPPTRGGARQTRGKESRDTFLLQCEDLSYQK